MGARGMGLNAVEEEFPKFTFSWGFGGPGGWVWENAGGPGSAGECGGMSHNFLLCDTHGLIWAVCGRF
jgi:hypothetical protein